MSAALDKWLDDYEAQIKAGQTSISRAEAIRRFNKWQDDSPRDQEEMEAEREDHRKIKEARQ